MSLIMNEYDSSEKFYKCFPVEHWVHYLSNECPNTSSIAYFLMDRPVYDREKHKDGFSAQLSSSE